MIKVLTGRCEPSTVMVRVKGKVRQENLRVETEMASPWLYAPAHSTVLSQQGRFLPQIAGGAASASNERRESFPTRLPLLSLLPSGQSSNFCPSVLQ